VAFLKGCLGEAFSNPVITGFGEAAYRETPKKQGFSCNGLQKGPKRVKSQKTPRKTGFLALPPELLIRMRSEVRILVRPLL